MQNNDTKDACAGGITPQYTVWCWNCMRWDQVSGRKASAIRDFRSAGWGKSRGKWLCPDCMLNGVKVIHAKT